MDTPTIDIVATCRNIRNLRIGAGKTVREIQRICGFNTPQAIYKWERGDALPTIDNMVILASVLDVKLDDIIVLNQ